jgi:hypothetical protein
MNRIMLQLYKKGFTDPRKITFDHVKRVLKDLALRRYYDNCMQAWCRITGKEPIRLNPVCEEKIRLMFQRIQEPFKKHCPADRKNFLSYPFVMYSFCDMLGYDELLPYFSLLKGKDKLKLQETIFAAICKDVGWDYKPGFKMNRNDV